MTFRSLAISICLAASALLLSAFYVQQDPFLDQLLQVLARYRQQYPQQKILMQLDKPYYLAGETLFFKGYLLNVHSGKLAQNSEMVYIILADARGRSHTAKVLAKGGLLHGQLHLPDTLPNGLYSLSAYTSLMRNSNKALFYQTQLRIHSAKDPKSVSLTPQPDLQLSFFPEGGSLVAGLGSKIVVRVANGAGSGRQVRGSIIGAQREEITTFITDTTGIGTFFLLPQKGVQYRVMVQEKEYLLPQVAAQGATLQVGNQPDHFNVVVNTSLPPQQELYLLAQAQGQVAFFAKGSGRGFKASLPKDSLPPGLCQLVLFNGEGQPLCQRLVYVAAKEVPLRLQLNSTNLAPRQQVAATLSLPASATETLYLSMSISKRQHKQPLSTQDLLLQNEFDRNLQEIQNVYGHPNLNEYLITENWVRYNWVQLTDSLPPPFYQHEPSLTFSGLLTDSENAILPQQEVSITLPGRLMPFEHQSDKNGYLHVPIYNFTGTEYVVLQPLNSPERFNTLRLGMDSPAAVTATPLPSYNTMGSPSPQLLQQAENWQIMQAYGVDPIAGRISAERKANVEYLKKQRLFTEEVILNEYISFPTLREVIREIVTGAFVPAGRDEIIVYADDAQQRFKGAPLLLVDGVPTYDAKAVLALDPAKIISIGVIRKQRDLFTFSAAGKNGVVVFTTTLPPDSHRFRDSNIIRFDGLTAPQHYAPADHSQPRTPDLRAGLYWNPMLQLSPQEETVVEFTTSDESGTFEIIIQGISSTGTPIYLRELIIVAPTD